MAKHLNVLIVEDLPQDAELTLRALRQGGFEPSAEIVASEAAMRSALDRRAWDVVISDHRMPSFSAPAALALLRSRGLDVPFIIVSASMGEEQAVESMRAGAQDYLVKGRLARLGAAIERELRDAATRLARDQAEQQARTADERYRALIGQIPAVAYLATIDAMRTLTYVSPQIEALTGDAPGEWTGRPGHWLSRVHPEDRFRVEQQMRRCREDATDFASEYRLTCRDDRVLWLRDEATLVRERAGAPMLRGFMIDITRARQSEETVRNIAFKDSLVSMVSHEARTPLSSIVGFTVLMLSRDFTPERRSEVLTIIHSEAVRLSSLVNDFLDVQRMQSGRCVYSFKPVDLRPLLESTVRTLVTSDRPSRVRLDAPADLPLVHADADRLCQVFANLIDNALKFSPKESDVTVSARARDDELVVAVTDRGIGIPADALPRLFTRFYRVENDSTRKVRGTGLGLAIVKDIVEAHHGRVWVESRLDEGELFHVALRVVAASVIEPAQADSVLAAPAPTAS